MAAIKSRWVGTKLGAIGVHRERTRCLLTITRRDDLTVEELTYEQAKELRDALIFILSE